MAGLVTAAVVIPKSMAYATVAGLPVPVGLNTAFAPMVPYAALGTSRVLSVSTTTTIGILTGAQLAAALRLGFLANFISEPLLVGFTAGIGVVIVMDQVPKLLDVHFSKGTFLQNLASLARRKACRKSSPSRWRSARPRWSC